MFSLSSCRVSKKLSWLFFVAIAGASSVSAVTVDYAATGWTHWADITLKTTSAGATVPGNVLKYPVLVQLTADNFPFSEAMTNGEDIRFAKTNKTSLSYEIESWDAVNKLAAVWVLVDTVYGNNATQKVVMFWGKSGQTSESNASTVFDTAYGFSAVYHMSQDPSGTAPQIKDATAHQSNGTTFGSMASTQLSNGLNGKAITFDGANDYVEIPSSNTNDFDSTRSFTISLWFNLATDALLSETGYGAQKMLQKRAGSNWYGFDIGGSSKTIYTDSIQDDSSQYFPDLGMTEILWRYTDSAVVITPNSCVAVFNNTAYLGQSSIVLGDWQQLVGVVDRTQQKALAYFGGAISNNGWGGDVFTATCSNAAPLRMGILDPGLTAQCFDGLLDEIRIENVARDSNWIKLCYENQKPSQSLVSITLINSTIGVLPGSALHAKVQSIFNAQNVLVSVYNLNGKKIAEQSMSGIQARAVVRGPVSLKPQSAKASPGMYIVRLQSLDKSNDVSAVTEKRFLINFSN